MIKQDNRLQTGDIFDRRIETLKRLLNDHDDDVSTVQKNEPPPAEETETKNRNETTHYIFVTGNNNIITTGKSKNICVKGAFLTGIVLCLLFF